MNFKKLSLAAALSIGILTVNGIANAACPVAQQLIPIQPAVPIVQTAVPVQLCPRCHVNPCTCQAVVPQYNACDAQISAALPNTHPHAKTFERQAFAFPSLGNSSIVMPKGSELIQIGGHQEAIALNDTYPSGLVAAPEYGGALTLFPKNVTGAAAPFGAVCPNQIIQGTDISRCNIPNSTSILQSNYLNSLQTGAAVPIAPFSGASAILQPSVSGFAAPIVQQQLPSGFAAPLSPFNSFNGAAAQLRGCPIPIETSSGLQFQKTELIPVAPISTGAACPVGDQYPDVSANTPSGCDINTETCQGVLAGYPDKYYKPNDSLKRSELAAAIVAGFDLRNVPAYSKQIFSDVSLCHWAKAAIDKAYNRGIITGNTCNKFRPEESATNAETLSALAKLIPASAAPCDIQSVLAAYPDSNEVPDWAKASVAKALNAGVTKCLPDSAHIKPNSPTQRTDIATMIKSLREKLCLETAKVAPCGAAAACPTYQPQVISGTIPTLKVEMEDIVTARTSLIGDVFVAKTIEPVTINGQSFPCGSKVRGRVVEVIRPGMGDNGGIRLGFNSIKNGSCVADLPKDVLSATVIKEKNPNIVGRTLAWPFTWTGKVVGIAGRTVGTTATVAANASEGVLNNFGNGTNEVFNGKFLAAGRSYFSSLREGVMGPVDLVKTAFSGTAGILKESGDEIAYVVSPDGARIAQVNPREKLSIAFGGFASGSSVGAAAPVVQVVP